RAQHGIDGGEDEREGNGASGDRGDAAEAEQPAGRQAVERQEYAAIDERLELERNRREGDQPGEEEIRHQIEGWRMVPGGDRRRIGQGIVSDEEGLEQIALEDRVGLERNGEAVHQAKA